MCSIQRRSETCRCSLRSRSCSARATSTIHKEWIRAATATRPDIDPDKWALLRNLIDAHAEDCLVTGYEPLIDVVTLPDPNDRHVLAAAIKGQADVIVTFNLKDYPPDILGVYDLNAQHLDVFVRHLIDLWPSAVIAAARTVRSRLKNPPRTVDEYLQTLERQGLVSTVSELRAFEEVL